MGKAILAHLPDDRVERIVERSGLPSKTDKTIVDLPRLKRELERTRQAGYGMADQEDVDNLRAVGAAILNFQDVPVAGLAISALSSQMDDRRMAELGAGVREAAAAISEQLGSAYYGYGDRLHRVE